jgi:two-component system KDP operon response regulator KdpE
MPGETAPTIRNATGPAGQAGRRQLLREVWGPAYDTHSNYLRVYMAQLRRKLEPDPSAPLHLITEAGMGYRFQP